MPKMTIGIVLFCSILSTSSFAASSSATHEVPNPCYNGGLNFGLAGYVSGQSMESASSGNASCADKPTEEELAQLKTLFS